MHISTFRKPICTAGIDVSLQSNSKITATVCQLYAVSVGAVGYIPSIALFCCLRRRWLQSISFQPLCLDLLVVYLASGSSWSFLYHHQFKTMGKTHNKAMYFFIISQVFLDFFPLIFSGLSFIRQLFNAGSAPSQSPGSVFPGHA